MQNAAARPAAPAPAALGAAVIALLAAAWLVLGYLTFVSPTENRLTRADAVVVLGSIYRDGREHYGFELAREYSATIVLSMQSPRQLNGNPSCASGGSGQLRVLCFQPSPQTTQGEAQQVRRYAQQYGWKTIIVVTSSYHVSRARMIVERCFAGRVEMSSPATRHSAVTIAYQYFYQSGAYVKAWLHGSSC